MNEISWDDFSKIALCVGTIIKVDDFPQAHKPAYKLQIDFGSEIGIKNSSAQITSLYTKENLIGKKIVAVVNFPKKQIGPFMSECLVTGFYRDDGVVLAVPDQDVANGVKLA
ncbi:tRNA-binding protein [Thiotrichales bacterium 19S3-7]|nr:tRNA-binding protein [Thiotrichales bacterium 19S3-7]MCF6802605.1 tRNA-binding protein [Thiotrichales bacterium 19S3-11]